MGHHVGDRDSLRDHARNHFTLHLRDSVMQSILRQDREYFDFHQVRKETPSLPPLFFHSIS
jgi:hypothetical protein